MTPSQRERAQRLAEAFERECPKVGEPEHVWATVQAPDLRFCVALLRELIAQSEDQGVGLAELDWNRLQAGERHPLDQRHLWAFDRIAQADEDARDAARLDWILDHCTMMGGGGGFELRVWVPVDCEDVRSAIDAAIAAQEKP